jgi:hypothetical protein
MDHLKLNFKSILPQIFLHTAFSENTSVARKSDSRKLETSSLVKAVSFLLAVSKQS